MILVLHFLPYISMSAVFTKKKTQMCCLSESYFQICLWIYSPFHWYVWDTSFSRHFLRTFCCLSCAYKSALFGTTRFFKMCPERWLHSLLLQQCTKCKCKQNIKTFRFSWQKPRKKNTNFFCKMGKTIKRQIQLESSSLKYVYFYDEHYSCQVIFVLSTRHIVLDSNPTPFHPSLICMWGFLERTEQIQ